MMGAQHPEVDQALRVDLRLAHLPTMPDDDISSVWEHTYSPDMVYVPFCFPFLSVGRI